MLRLMCEVRLLDVKGSALFDPCLGIDGLCLPLSSPLICLVDPVEVVDAHFAAPGVGSRGEERVVRSRLSDTSVKRPTVGRRCDLPWVDETTYSRFYLRSTVGPFLGVSETACYAGWRVVLRLGVRLSDFSRLISLGSMPGVRGDDGGVVLLNFSFYMRAESSIPVHIIWDEPR